ncbi:MAPEG family protein [Sphingomonas sp. PAMC 26605]|uniref:MAPEG family protein n=1 Tax=Sphingomonas sp. PAMC 26605 TaxID=1112214 RepID=UPI00026CB1D1|nr:MAPEG family protein [Sphingomonas sp. PAMC 26605]
MTFSSMGVDALDTTYRLVRQRNPSARRTVTITFDRSGPRVYTVTVGPTSEAIHSLDLTPEVPQWEETMRIEYTMLGATIVLALFNVLWAGNARTKQYGTEWNLSARDTKMPPLEALAARLLRAQANLYETMPLFIGALLGASQLSHLGWKTEMGSVIYFIARLAYLPVYAAGIPKLRTAIWLVSIVGLLFILWAMLFN